MQSDLLVFTIFLIFTGAAVMATLALYARQALLVAYIVLGMLFGPSGLELVNDPALVKQISHVGIMFLLFLLGLNLPPSKLVPLLRETTLVTGLSSLLFASIGAESQSHYPGLANRPEERSRMQTSDSGLPALC